MPRYYCDYCDTYLTHDSPSVRKQHNAGYKHKANVRTYYQQFEEQQTQSLIDQRIKEHLGQAAAYQQVGAAFNQHLGQRPRLPVLPPPVLAMPGSAPSPLIPGMRPPVLPRPIAGAPGYMAPPTSVLNLAPPGAPSLPMQVPPGPPAMNIPTSVQGGMQAPSSNGASSTITQAMYEPNPTAPTNGGFDNINAASSLQRPTGNSIATNTSDIFN